MQPTVLKFGGTSVHDEAALVRLADIVRSQLDDFPVVVVITGLGMLFASIPMAWWLGRRRA
jgi:aspartokinase